MFPIFIPQIHSGGRGNGRPPSFKEALIMLLIMLIFLFFVFTFFGWMLDRTDGFPQKYTGTYVQWLGEKLAWFWNDIVKNIF